MAEFFFGSWPHGVGPGIIQFVLVVAGAFAGVRMIDDLKMWMQARSEVRNEPSVPPNL